MDEFKDGTTTKSTERLQHWLSTYHAAQILDITPRQLVAKVHRGIIRAHRVIHDKGHRRGRLYFDKIELMRYQQSHPMVGRKDKQNG